MAQQPGRKLTSSLSKAGRGDGAVQGFACYINDSENCFRLIVSPLLRDEDQAAIEEGLKDAETVAREILEELIVTEDLLQKHTLRCLSWLLRAGRIEIKIALMESALFHPKVWLLDDNGDVLAAHGSSNMTHAGIRKNVEQIAVSKSWEDPNQRYITDKLSFQFSQLWRNREDSCIVVSLPQAVRDKLLRSYHSETPPTEAELRTLYRKAADRDSGAEPVDLPAVQHSEFIIPEHLQYVDGRPRGGGVVVTRGRQEAGG